MTDLPVHGYDPDDPVEIMRVLPAHFHAQFRADYDAAATRARQPEEYKQLHHVLRLWRLRAAAYSDPSYEARLAAAGVETGRGVPIEEIVPDWNERVETAMRRRAGE